MEFLQTRKSYLVMVLLFLPVWSISGLILGVVMSFGLTQNGSWPLFWIGCAIPLLCVLLFVRFIRSKARSMSDELASEIVTPTTDYYHYTNVSAIAVDVANRLVTVHTLPPGGNRKKKARYQFSIDKIRRYRAEKPGHTSYETASIDPMHQSFAYAQSAMSGAQAWRNTGLVLELDDLMRPELFVRMEFESARRWFMVFDKLSEGTLEQQRAPFRFQ